MAFYTDLFSPETYQAYKASSRDISGFRPRHKSVAEKVRRGDVLVCYMTRLSRWFGLLEVIEGPFSDSKPIFTAKDDPFTVRFRVRPIVLLEPDNAIPMHDPPLWNSLSFTRDLPAGSWAWSGMVRSSLVRLGDEDGRLLSDALRRQASEPKLYTLNDSDARKLATHVVSRIDKDVPVSVPEDARPGEVAGEQPEEEVRESIQMQALIARIGTQMGLSIWLPKADRAPVLRAMGTDALTLLDRLPLNYDDTTLRTIEQIDVLWLRGRSIVRAFEVEHTTSVYSGILRMADLLALQPNMDIKLHIVAPLAKQEKVFNEIRRPVFSLLERGPLAESCTYLSYDSLRVLASQKHLAHLSDSVLDEYAEDAQ
jgi:hypothetical protein